MVHHISILTIKAAMHLITDVVTLKISVAVVSVAAVHVVAIHYQTAASAATHVRFSMHVAKEGCCCTEYAARHLQPLQADTAGQRHVHHASPKGTIEVHTQQRDGHALTGHHRTDGTHCNQLRKGVAQLCASCARKR